MSDTREYPANKYRFTNLRKPTTEDELTEYGREQLETVARLYFGNDQQTADMLGHDFIELWDIVDEDGKVVFEGWFYFVDSGTIFHTGTTEVLGEIIQHCFDCGDEALAHEIRAAAETITTPKKNAPSMVAWTED